MTLKKKIEKAHILTYSYLGKSITSYFCLLSKQQSMTWQFAEDKLNVYN